MRRSETTLCKKIDDAALGSLNRNDQRAAAKTQIREIRVVPLRVHACTPISSSSPTFSEDLYLGLMMIFLLLLSKSSSGVVPLIGSGTGPGVAKNQKNGSLAYVIFL